MSRQDGEPQLNVGERVERKSYTACVYVNKKKYIYIYTRRQTPLMKQEHIQMLNLTISKYCFVIDLSIGKSLVYNTLRFDDKFFLFFW